MRPANASLDPDLITLTRIIACFPRQACDLLQRGVGRTFISKADLGYGESVELPTRMLSSHFVVMLPITQDLRTANLHFTCFLVHILIDDILHSKKKDFTGLAQMFVYYSAAYKTAGVPRYTRRLYCSHLDLMNAYRNGFLEVHITANTDNRARIRERRRHDPSLNKIIEELSTL